jgi:hypothetical protein
MLRSVKMPRVMSQFGALDGHCETFDLYRIPEVSRQFQILFEGFLLRRSKILLALGLLFFRAPPIITKIKVS